MSRVSKFEEFDEGEDVLELTGKELEEVEAAIAEADASNPEDWVDAGEFLRRLRNGE